MSLWLVAPVLSALSLPAPVSEPAESTHGLTPQLTIERRVVQDDDEEGAPCREAREAENWAEVINLCGALMESRPEGHEDWGEEGWETTKQNVDYAYRVQCEAAAQAQDWGGAIANCGPASERYPDAFQFHLYLALAHQSSQDAENAITEFRSFLSGVEGNPEMAAQLGPQVVFARSSLANALLSTGDSEAAIPLLREAAAGDPGNAEVRRNLMLALLEAGDFDGAEAAYQEAIALEPDNAQVSEVFFREVFRQGANSFNAQEYDAATASLTKYLAGLPDGEYATEAHWMVGEVAIRNNENGLALTHYRAFLERAPDDERAATVNYSVGMIYFNRSQCDTAQRYLRRFRRLAPRDPNGALVDDILLDFEDGICEPGV